MRYLGRYRLDAVHGVGAFATVWRGWDDQLQAEVAIKVLADNWAHHGDVRERFLEEARILRRIIDHRVVRVLDVGVVEDRPYFVMDFVSGGTVDDLIGTVDLQTAVNIAEQAARAVQVLHEHGVLHRDIKPSNFLLNGDRVLVSDLGSAKRLAEASRITVTTGTPTYMAPEQVSGDPMDVRTDVYALGVMTYELVIGHPPRDAGPRGTGSERTFITGADRALDKTITSATKTRPEDRPRTAEDFADALRDAIRPKAVATVSARLVALTSVIGFVAALAAVLAARG